ncbi:hypothetical protein RJ43_08985 [Alteromonas macleodii]|nr:hypothetical protein RJ43_08985 [Alteromonas macleodii]
MPRSTTQSVMKYFDTDWYCKNYPDVEKSGMEPSFHFMRFGMNEGRWPCHFKAVELDKKLWSSKEHEKVLNDLVEIFAEDEDGESDLAAWFLGRWFASQSEWKTAHHYSRRFEKKYEIFNLLKNDGPAILLVSCYENLKIVEDIEKVINELPWVNCNEKSLAHCSVAKNKEKKRHLNAMFHYNKLTCLAKGVECFDSLQAIPQYHVSANWYSPLVSIIMPCFNSEETISVAINCLLEQTYKKVEIIIVDDASTDNSAQIISEFAKKDRRVRYLKLAKNSGAYVARNTGLKAARGRYITTHDADDWSHPQKIELQVKALKSNGKAKASVSHWARCKSNVSFLRWRIESGWIHRNVSSLMFDRTVFRKLGYWDSVSVNADTEYYYRILSKYGHNSIIEVLPGTPLAFGRVELKSLTQQSITHISTQFEGIRKDYLDSAREWHGKNKRLYMPFDGERKFVVPPYICRGKDQVRKNNLRNYIVQNDLFDEKWYLDKYEDIKSAGVNPVEHYISHGIYEGREPNALLCPSAYSYLHDCSLYDGVIRWTTAQDKLSTIVQINGDRTRVEESESVLMVGHLAGEHLFGAERSFLDCVMLLQRQDINIHIILPEAKNKPYIEDLKKHCVKITFIPLKWWKKGRNVVDEHVDLIACYIKRYEISCVYSNTITLWEPSLAADLCSVKKVMHIREITGEDPELCNLLGADSIDIKKHLKALNNLYIANSNTTAKHYQTFFPCEIIPNIIDSACLKTKHHTYKESFNVTMISSNLPKKGIQDFFEIARLCEEKCLPISFSIYGPETDILLELLNDYTGNNVCFRGVTDDISETLSNIDVLLCLSHFAESFGRTVLEAMAHGCIVIGYQFGAIVELLESGCGILVEPRNQQAVAYQLEAVLNNQNKMQPMIDKAQKKVKHNYLPEVVSANLAKLVTK